MTETKDISYLLNKLISKYNPSKIICFHRHAESKNLAGCFQSSIIKSYCDYWLLLVTDSLTRIEHAVQDFSNAHYNQGTVTLLVHGNEGIDNATNTGNSFFKTVYSTGQVYYSRDGMLGNNVHDNPSAAHIYTVHSSATAKNRFKEGASRAEGFLRGAIDCLENKNYNVCAFMMHQVVEQCCIALIWLHMDYRCDIHNLSRLLQLCRCFTHEPYALFCNGNAEDERLFAILVASYSKGRYIEEFKVTEKDLHKLSAKCSQLLSITKRHMD